MSLAAIPIDEMKRRLAEGAVDLIDVRTPAEYESLHATGARSVPLDRLEPAQVQAARRGAVYLLCKSGQRARKAAERLASAGVGDVFVVDGGTDAWAAAGLPVVRGRAMMSLERQVRIAAGLLVLAGVGLGQFLHPGFYGLSAFVGAGLVFAGVTDTCGMAMALGRMPWNRRGATCAA